MGPIVDDDEAEVVPLFGEGVEDVLHPVVGQPGVEGDQGRSGGEAAEDHRGGVRVEAADEGQRRVGCCAVTQGGRPGRRGAAEFAIGDRAVLGAQCDVLGAGADHLGEAVGDAAMLDGPLHREIRTYIDFRLDVQAAAARRARHPAQQHDRGSRDDQRGDHLGGEVGVADGVDAQCGVVTMTPVTTTIPSRICAVTARRSRRCSRASAV